MSVTQSQNNKKSSLPTIILCASLAIFLTIIILLVKIRSIIWSPRPTFLKWRNPRTLFLAGMYVLGCSLITVSASLLIFSKHARTLSRTIRRGRSYAIAGLYFTVLFLATSAILAAVPHRYSYYDNLAWRNFYSFHMMLMGPALAALVFAFIFTVNAESHLKRHTGNFFYGMAKRNFRVLIVIAILALLMGPIYIPPAETHW